VGALNIYGLDGSLENPSANGVKVKDNAGFQVANDAGTVGLSIAANGDITDNSGAVTINDSDGVSAPKYYDSDNTFYYDDPSNFSYLNNIYLSGKMYDYPSGSYYVDPATTSILNNLYTGIGYFNTLYDWNNTTYYLDPSSPVTSLNAAGAITANGVVKATNGSKNAALWPDGGVQADANMTVSGWIYNVTGNPTFNPNNDVMINDNLNVMGYIYDNDSAIVLNDTVSVNGSLTATSIGNYYETGWTSSADTIPAGTSENRTVSCTAGDTAVSCMEWKGNYLVQPRYVYVSGASCTSQFTNANGFDTFAQVNALCFSPN
jgi:hypothetical protein